jgi:hypothetical protein
VGRRLFVSVFSPGAVVCLDRDSGRIIWRRRPFPFGDSSVLHADPLLYAKTPHTLYALDPGTGRLVWKFSPYGPDGETMYSAPSVKNGRLFIGDRNGYLHALDALSGRPLWRVLTSPAMNNAVNGPPFIQGGRVFVAANAGRFLALEAATGSIVWNLRLGHSCINEIVVCPDAFVVLTGKTLNWIDRRSGKLLAQQTLPRRRHSFGLAARKRNLVITTYSDGRGGHELLGFRDGRLLFTKRHDCTSLRWLPSGLLVETRYDGIGILNPATGEQLHNIEFHEACEAAKPAEYEGHLYLLTVAGAVLALRWPPSGKQRR